PGGRVLVIGDSDFASNSLLAQGQNQDLLLNAVAWMVDEEDQIASRSTESASGLLTLTGLQGILVWLIAVVAGPGLAVALALRSWFKRRSL
ncbi:ABC transporter, partial [Myxococcota bacterium]|nr:ABC transporter [Myxococcota bacterium]